VRTARGLFRRLGLSVNPCTRYRIERSTGPRRCGCSADRHCGISRTQLDQDLETPCDMSNSEGARKLFQEIGMRCILVRRPDE
jgi:hypothetical protein